ENLDQAGGCYYNYACAYTDTISWANPSQPLPMIRNPRVAFDLLFGAGNDNSDRAARRKQNASILDFVTGERSGLKKPPGPAYQGSGTNKGFHPASHHGGREQGVLDFNLINRYHVSMLPYFLNKLKESKEGDSDLLEKTAIIYGSPMADGNIHNHRRCPLLLLGHGNGVVTGDMHLRAPDGTPMAN